MFGAGKSPYTDEHFQGPLVMQCMISGASLKRSGLQELLQQKSLVASLLALIVHLVGLVGMVYIDRDWFASLTPINLLLMSFLVIWTHGTRGKLFYAFLSLAFLSGMFSEIIGVNTGLLFGNYAYGDVLGLKWMGVPLIIGMNWFVVVMGAVALMVWLIDRFTSMLDRSGRRRFPVLLREWVICLGAALLAVAFDWVMEPVAIKMGFWAWAGNGEVPIFNYFCWFGVSLFMVSVLRVLRIPLQNVFPVHLLLIQAVFFGMIRLLT